MRRRSLTSLALLLGVGCAGAVTATSVGGADEVAVVRCRQGTDEARARRFFEQARSLVDEGRWQAARQAILAALALDADEPEALDLLGMIEEQRGALEAAITAYRRAVAADPQGGTFYFNLGRALVKNEAWVEAEAALRQAAGLLPDSPRPHGYLGLILRRLQRPAEAAAAFERALRLDPQQGELAFDLATARRAAGDDVGALEAARRAAELLPDNPSVQHLLARLLAAGHSDDNLVQAAVAYRRALATSSDRPADGDLYSGLAEVYFRLGLPQEAESALRQAIELQPEKAENYFNLAQMIYKQRRYEESLAAYEHALELDPGHGTSQLFRGYALLQLSREDEALAAFERAAALLPGNSEPHLEAAKLLIDKGRFEAAQAHLMRAVNRGVAPPEVGLLMGRLRMEQGRATEAISILGRVIEADPELLEAEYRLGQALVKAGRVEEGRERLADYQLRFRKAQKEAADTLHSQLDQNSQVYLLWGRLYLAENRPERAVQSLRSATELRPDDRRAWRLLVQAYTALGDLAGAAEAQARLDALKERTSTP
ncbi:MAG: tetratricopeptide repeat protein [Acidobacteriota bacterium]